MYLPGPAKNIFTHATEVVYCIYTLLKSLGASFVREVHSGHMQLSLTYICIIICLILAGNSTWGRGSALPSV